MLINAKCIKPWASVVKAPEEKWNETTVIEDKLNAARAASKKPVFGKRK